MWDKANEQRLKKLRQNKKEGEGERRYKQCGFQCQTHTKCAHYVYIWFCYLLYIRNNIFRFYIGSWWQMSLYCDISVYICRGTAYILNKVKHFNFSHLFSLSFFLFLFMALNAFATFLTTSDASSFFTFEILRFSIFCSIFHFRILSWDYTILSLLSKL